MKKFLAGILIGGVVVWIGANAWHVYSLVMVPINGHRKRKDRRWWL